jgi:hypothetical protein
MPIKTSLSCLLTLSMLLSPFFLCHADQDRSVGRTFTYKITSKGFGVGRFKTVLAPLKLSGDKVVRFESELAIDANLLFCKVTSSAREEAVIGASGAQRYRRHGQENGKNSSVEASLENDSFRFRLIDEAGSRSVAVPRTSYDFTTIDCPETTMKHPGDTLEVRLLDLEHAKVVQRKFHWVKNEELEIGGKRMHCRVVDFSDPANKCRRWVACGPDGVVIVRQDGTGKHGSYSLRLVSLVEAPA